MKIDINALRQFNLLLFFFLNAFIKLNAMRPFLEEEFGNPPSARLFGKAPNRAVAAARVRAAEMLACEPEEVIFTSAGFCRRETSIYECFELVFCRSGHDDVQHRMAASGKDTGCQKKRPGFSGYRFFA